VDSPAKPLREKKEMIRVSADRAIQAAPDRVYEILADFRNHHPKILPPAFCDFRVESGGRGAGTVVAYRLKLAGRRWEARSRVEEPEPGRVLTETVADSGAVTTFTVTPEGSGSRVRIDTTWPGAKGISGWIERWVAPRLLRRLYAQELELLDRHAQNGL
jgi:hypothetical protein